MQVAADPSVASEPSSSAALSDSNSLASQSGFAGVRRSVSSDRYVGSGLQLQLELSSGQSIELNIEKRVSGGVREVSLTTHGEISKEDQAKLKHIFTKISETLDAMFASGTDAPQQGAFDFANMTGVKDIELTVQQDKGNIKQRLEFEKQHSANGRKEVEAQWSRYNHATGQNEQHNFALSKQPREAAMAYGQMDYQWVVDQVTAGMGILGNSHTGESSLQHRVTDFFVAGIHALFSDSQKSQSLLQGLGAFANDAKQLIGQTIRAVTAEQNTQPKQHGNTNMPGEAIIQTQQDGRQAMSSLPDFKADFASTRNAAGNGDGRYNLTMAISQTSHLMQGATEEDTTQAQFRRLLLKYDSKNTQQEYEYNWRHDEVFINRYKNGLLEKGYVKVEDLQQGILSSLNQSREETRRFMQRTEYEATKRDDQSMQNSYVSPDIYTEQGRNVNYTV